MNRIAPVVKFISFVLQEEENNQLHQKTWPLDSPAPRFRNYPEGMKAFQEVVDTLSKDKDYTFPKAGLGSSAIAQIIRKHMDERKRKEPEIKQLPSSHSESDASSTSGENSPESG